MASWRSALKDVRASSKEYRREQQRLRAHGGGVSAVTSSSAAIDAHRRKLVRPMPLPITKDTDSSPRSQEALRAAASRRRQRNAQLERALEDDVEQDMALEQQIEQELHQNRVRSRQNSAHLARTHGRASHSSTDSLDWRAMSASSAALSAARRQTKASQETWTAKRLARAEAVAKRTVHGKSSPDHFDEERARRKRLVHSYVASPSQALTLGLSGARSQLRRAHEQGLEKVRIRNIARHHRTPSTVPSAGSTRSRRARLSAEPRGPSGKPYALQAAANRVSSHALSLLSDEVAATLNHYGFASKRTAEDKPNENAISVLHSPSAHFTLTGELVNHMQLVGGTDPDYDRWRAKKAAEQKQKHKNSASDEEELLEEHRARARSARAAQRTKRNIEKGRRRTSSLTGGQPPHVRLRLHHKRASRTRRTNVYQDVERDPLAPDALSTTIKDFLPSANSRRRFRHEDDDEEHPSDRSHGSHRGHARKGRASGTAAPSPSNPTFMTGIDLGTHEEEKRAKKDSTHLAKQLDKTVDTFEEFDNCQDMTIEQLADVTPPTLGERTVAVPSAAKLDEVLSMSSNGVQFSVNGLKRTRVLQERKVIIARYESKHPQTMSEYLESDIEEFRQFIEDSVAHHHSSRVIQESWFQYFLSPASKRIVHDSFWYALAIFFGHSSGSARWQNPSVPHTPNPTMARVHGVGVGPALSSCLNRIAANFVDLFLSVQPQHKDMFFHHYYDALAQSIFYCLVRCFPRSAGRLCQSLRLKLDLLHMTAMWTMGHLPSDAPFRIKLWENLAPAQHLIASTAPKSGKAHRTKSGKPSGAGSDVQSGAASPSSKPTSPRSPGVASALTADTANGGTAEPKQRRAVPTRVRDELQADDLMLKTVPTYAPRTQTSFGHCVLVDRFLKSRSLTGKDNSTVIGLSAAAPIANVVAGTGGMGRGPASTAAIAAAMIASTDKTGPRSAQLLAKRVAATRIKQRQALQSEHQLASLMTDAAADRLVSSELKRKYDRAQAAYLKTTRRDWALLRERRRFLERQRNSAMRDAHTFVAELLAKRKQEEQPVQSSQPGVTADNDAKTKGKAPQAGRRSGVRSTTAEADHATQATATGQLSSRDQSQPASTSPVAVQNGSTGGSVLPANWEEDLPVGWEDMADAKDTIGHRTLEQKLGYKPHSKAFATPATRRSRRRKSRH